MPVENFFEHQTPESKAKVDIVTNFFATWLNIVGRHGQSYPLAYMELFAGQGIYDDGTLSTPIIVLDHILTSPHAGRFKVILNEYDPAKVAKLDAAVRSRPIYLLASEPLILQVEVDAKNVVSMLRHLPKAPAVLFADPFGYRGITRELFTTYVNGSWGRDAVFFFNYKRVNAALSEPLKAENMEAMFGVQRARSLRTELDRLTITERKKRVIDALVESLQEVGIKYVTRFEFEEREDSLFFISQHHEGLRAMKRVMGNRSTVDNEGVPSFSYARKSAQPKPQRTFSFMSPPSAIGVLKEDLLKRFVGRTVRFDELFIEHNAGTNFIEQNYRAALEQLAHEGRIKTESDSPRARREGTFGPKIRIVFPRKG